VHRRHDALARVGLVLGEQPVGLHRDAVAVEQRIELAEREVRRTLRREQEQVAFALARLDRHQVARLQHLRLEQLGDACDLVARLRAVRVGEQAVRGVVADVGVDRLPALDERQTLEAEVVVDAAEARAARGRIGVEQQARAVDGAVVVARDRALEALERLDRAIGGLLRDRVVEPRRRVVGIEFLRLFELARVEAGPLLFVVGLAEVAAHDRVARIEAHRDLELARAVGDVALADRGEAEPQMWHRIGLVELDRARKCAPRIVGLDAHQVGEPAHGLRARELGRERRGLLGGARRAAQIAGGGAQLCESCPGESVARLDLDGRLEARARARQIEARLLRVRGGDVRRRGLRIRRDRALGRRLRIVVAVLRDRDHRLERERVGIVGRDLLGARDVGERLVDIARGEPLRRARRVEARIVARRGTRARRHHGRVVERPVHRVARARDDARHGRTARLGNRRLSARDHELSGVVRGQHAAFEHRDLGAPFFDGEQELGAAHAGDRVGGLDLELAVALARQEVRGAAREAHPVGLAVANTVECHLGLRAQADHRLVLQRQVGATVIARAHGVTHAQHSAALDGLPVARTRRPHLDRALGGHHARERRVTRLCDSRRRVANGYSCGDEHSADGALACNFLGAQRNPIDLRDVPKWISTSVRRTRRGARIVSGSLVDEQASHDKKARRSGQTSAHSRNVR
jgi:hypothetical protein